jgi:pterin-4a-carbinolamine dehydratase
MTEWISPNQFLEAEGVEDWRVLNDGVSAYFATGKSAAGALLALAIGDLDGLGPLQPDVDVRHDGVTVRLVTIGDDRFGLSERDVELARQISGVARELGATPDPSAVQAVQVAIDAMSHPEVMAFWRAVAAMSTATTSARTSWIFVAGDRSSGSSRWTSLGRSATASTSTSGCRPRWPRGVSPRRSPPGAAS